MPLYRHTITCQTRGRGTTNITSLVQNVVTASESTDGLVHLFLKHTSASLILCENAAPDVRTDLETFMSNLVEDGSSAFLHQDEGPDDMPAHIRSILTTNDMTVPVSNGRLDLGVWQGIFLWEHRTSAYSRSIVVSVR